HAAFDRYRVSFVNSVLLIHMDGLEAGTWARSRKGSYESDITPTLQSVDGRTAETVEAKTALVSESFFPAIPEADLADIDSTVYPKQLPFPEITRHEIEQVVCLASPDKAPSEDSIPNNF
ncbi:hypothetical protein TSTA_070400, partial [Talaromyces stipitatus ATCC 10500]